MDAFVSFKFLHIVSMIFAVALAVSSEIVVRRVATTGDAAAIRVTIARTKPLSPIAGALFLVGLAFGLLTAITGEFDLLRPWLIGSYVLFATAFAISLGIIDPWVGRLESAAATETGEGASPAALQAVIEDPRARAASWGLQVIVTAIVFLMVVKPLG